MAGRRVDSRRKGITAEQHAARWFAEHVHRDAYRVVRTGWSSNGRAAQDPGDLALPGLCVQVKNLARPLVGKLLLDTWEATVTQAGDRQPMILEKRVGTADVGHWWLHLWSAFYVELVTYMPRYVASGHLVRVLAGDLASDLGYWCRNIERR